MPTAAAVYVRISDDRQGAALGVTRQREDCEALAKRKGWPIANVYIDNDTSAYGSSVRPQYRRLLDDIRTGAVDAVIVWHLDRLHRQPKELEEFFEVCEAAGVKHMASVTGDVDLSTHDGQFMARILGAVSRKESDDKSRRLRRKHEELALAGKVGGGGTRPFGFKADRVTIRQAEAELIREAAERFIAGESVGGICKDWHRRGIRGVRGGPWRTVSMRNMLSSPRIAGLRELRGEVVGAAAWPAIITRADHERITALLSDPERRKGGRPREYLLTGGMGRCGLCGEALTARPKADGRRCYVCATGTPGGFKGCGKIRCLAEPLEDEVSDVVLAALDGPGLRDALQALAEDGDHASLIEQLRDDEDALEELEVAHFTDGHLSRAGYLKARAKLNTRIEGARTALRRQKRSGVLHSLPSGAEALRAEWDARGIHWRRSVIAAVLEEVIVGPAVKGRNFFDPDRVQYRWRA